MECNSSTEHVSHTSWLCVCDTFRCRHIFPIPVDHHVERLRHTRVSPSLSLLFHCCVVSLRHTPLACMFTWMYIVHTHIEVFMHSRRDGSSSTSVPCTSIQCQSIPSVQNPIQCNCIPYRYVCIMYCTTAPLVMSLTCTYVCNE